MDLTDLCSVADVNSRFRQNSRNQFASPKFQHDFLCLDYSDIGARLTLFTRDQPNGETNETRSVVLMNLSPNQKLLRISKFLRNFGMLVESIRVDGKRDDDSYRNDIFSLISIYCTGTLTELMITCCEITGEIETYLRPLLRHIHKLSFSSCHNSQFYERMLSSWSPQLRELKFSGRLLIMPNPTHILGQVFPKLVLISFCRVSNLDNTALEGFLRLNPQLKKIGLLACPNINGSIFQSIATHVHQLEALQIDMIADGNLKHFGQLKNLSTLKLWFFDVNLQPVFTCDQDYPAVMPSILHEIHAANIPLQHLRIGHITGLFYETDQLIDAISKLESLKTLFLLGYGLRLEIAHVLRICKQLPELSELILAKIQLMMTPDDLLELIRYSPKLQTLHHIESDVFIESRRRRDYRERVRAYYYRCRELGMQTVYYPDFPEVEPIPGSIDAYMKMVQLVQQRREKTRLFLEVNKQSPILLNIPKELIRMYNHTVSLEATTFGSGGMRNYFMRRYF